MSYLKGISKWVMMIVFVTMIWGCAGAPEFTVLFNKKHGLQIDDYLYMNGVAIGQIRDIVLKSPNEVACTVRLISDYKTFVNKSAVFTYQKDSENQSRQCLVCKNCDEMAPAATTGHVFNGMGFIAYTLSCLGQQTDNVWGEYMKDTLESLIEEGGNFSEETQDKMEAFARTSREAFEEALHEFNELIDDLDEEAQETLEEIRKRTQQ